MQLVWFWPEQCFAKYIYHTTKLYQLYFVHKKHYKTRAVKLALLLQSMKHQTKPSIEYFIFMDRFDCGFDTCLVLKWWMSQLVLLMLKRILFHLSFISLVNHLDFQSTRLEKRRLLSDYFNEGGLSSGLFCWVHRRLRW